MRYQPRDNNGELVKLSWPVSALRRLNPFVWPFEEIVTTREVVIDRIWIIFGILLLGFNLEACIHYLLINYQNVEIFMVGVPVAFLELELFLRGWQVTVHKDRFRELLQLFYAEIYMSETLYPAAFDNIKKKMRAARIIATSYASLIFVFILQPVLNIIQHKREPPLAQAFHFDHTKLQNYIAAAFVNLMEGAPAAIYFLGEINILGEIMMHLNYRYLKLGHDFHQIVANLLESGDTTNIVANYNRELIKVLRRNAFLNEFANQLEELFTVRIFVIYSFSAIVLCTLAYGSYSNPSKNVVYVFWLISKIFELLIIGYFGSTLSQTTNELDIMYYSSGWEQVIHRSENAAENVKLMKLLVLSIQMNSQPVTLTGLKYFKISVTTVVAILQGGFSYFAFLNSVE